MKTLANLEHGITDRMDDRAVRLIVVAWALLAIARAVCALSK